MVWLKTFFVFLFLLSNASALEITNEEKNYFDIIDLNNDGFVSVEEINQTMNIIFQLIDINKDEKISLIELEELKEIMKIFK